MSKLGCICGNLIVDQSNNLPYKADLIPDNSFDEFMDKFFDDLNGFLIANNDNEKIEWLKTLFASPPYPNNLKDSDIIFDIFHKHYLNYTKEILQCESCGRIWIQKNNSNKFISFIPDDNEWKGILDKTTHNNT